MKLYAVAWLPMLLFLTACSAGGDLNQLELKKKIIESIAGSDEMAIDVGPVIRISEPTRSPQGTPESTSSWEYREVQVEVELRKATFKTVGFKKSHPFAESYTYVVEQVTPPGKKGLLVGKVKLAKGTGYISAFEPTAFVGPEPSPVGRYLDTIKKSPNDQVQIATRNRLAVF